MLRQIITIKSLLLIFFVFTKAFTQDIQKSYFDNGNVKTEISFINNIRDGYTKYYFENGNLSEEMFFCEGILTGTYLQFYESGQKKLECTYKNGILDGIALLYTETGDIASITKYDSGKVSSKQTFAELVTTNRAAAKQSKIKVNLFTDNFKSDPNSTYLKVPTRKFNIKIPDKYKGFSVYKNGVYLLNRKVEIPEGLINQIYPRIKYPKEALDIDLEGVTLVLVNIGNNGTVIRSEIVYYLGLGCDSEVLNVIKNANFESVKEVDNPGVIQLLIPVIFQKQ